MLYVWLKCYKCGNCVIYFIELNNLLMINIIILLDYIEYCFVKFGKILFFVEKLILLMGWYVFCRGLFVIKKRGKILCISVFSVLYSCIGRVFCFKILVVYEVYFFELYDIY